MGTTITRALMALALASVPALWGAAAGADGGKHFALHETPRDLPTVEFQDGDGQHLSLSQFRGRVVLLNIWATWCGPCRKEMPTLDRLQERLGSADFEVVALSVDRAGASPVREFYAEIGIQQLGVYVDDTMRSMRGLGVLGLPTTLLLDRDGREIGRLVGPAEWDTQGMIDFLRTHIPTRAGGLRPPSSLAGIAPDGRVCLRKASG